MVAYVGLEIVEKWPADVTLYSVDTVIRWSVKHKLSSASRNMSIYFISNQVITTSGNGLNAVCHQYGIIIKHA